MQGVLLALSFVLAASPAGPPAQAAYVVTPRLEAKRLDVTASLEAPAMARLCVDMPGAGAALRDVRLEPGDGGAPVPLREDPDDADCVRLPRPLALAQLRYTVDLGALSAHHNDADFAAELPGGWVFHDAAALLHSADLPDDAQLTVDFRLPEALAVATPWPRVGPGRFAFSGKQHDAGAYVALGKLRTLEPLTTPLGVAQVTLLDAPKRADDATLRRWVSSQLDTLSRFYGAWPSPSPAPLHLVLAPVPSDEPGVFGTVLRRQAPSVLLLFGAEATAGFDDDWVALHELFHLGNPPIEGRFAWFIEGFTTYATELLRGRAGSRDEARVWGDLAQGLRTYCQPERGVSLGQASRELRQVQNWQRVYWGGACLALRVDVAVRQRSGGKRSLDDVLRALRASPKPLTEAQVTAALDEAAGAGLASGHLGQTRPVPLEPLLRNLGVGAVKAGRAVLDDGAPLAALRRALTLPPAPGGALHGGAPAGPMR